MNEIAIYLTISALSFLGLYCGLLTGYFAKEELEPGRLYLNRLYYIILATILAAFLFLNQSIVFFLGVPLLLILFSLPKHRETLYYYAVGMLLGLSYLYNGFIIIASLTFLLGFPLGSIYLLDNIEEKTKQVAKGLLVKYSPYLLITLAFGIWMIIN
jgi:hypothetical protein